jgi:hypothetical protein
LFALEGRLSGECSEYNPGGEGTNLGAATRVDGNYIILTVPAGLVTLRVTDIGYAPATISNIRANSDITTTVLQTDALSGSGASRGNSKSVGKYENEYDCAFQCESSCV